MTQKRERALWLVRSVWPDRSHPRAVFNFVRSYNDIGADWRNEKFSDFYTLLYALAYKCLFLVVVVEHFPFLCMLFFCLCFVMDFHCACIFVVDIRRLYANFIPSKQYQMHIESSKFQIFFFFSLQIHETIIMALWSDTNIEPHLPFEHIVMFLFLHQCDVVFVSGFNIHWNPIYLHSFFLMPMSQFLAEKKKYKFLVAFM